MRFSRSWPALLSIVSLAACGDPLPSDPDGSAADGGTGDAGPAYPSYCENINPTECLLPWPSSFYLRDDPTTERSACARS